MKTLILSILAIYLSSSTAFAQETSCQWMSEFSFVKTIEEWQINNIEPTIYLEDAATSKIGEFKLHITGGTHQEQLVSYDQLSCSPSPGAVNYTYTEKVVLQVGQVSEIATEATLTFPNGFEIKVGSEKFTSNRMQLLPEGIKEIGPFAPAGVLPTAQAILAIGKLELSAENFETLNAAFR